MRRLTIPLLAFASLLSARVKAPKPGMNPFTKDRDIQPGSYPQQVSNQSVALHPTLSGMDLTLPDEAGRQTDRPLRYST